MKAKIKRKVKWEHEEKKWRVDIEIEFDDEDIQDLANTHEVTIGGVVATAKKYWWGYHIMKEINEYEINEQQLEMIERAMLEEIKKDMTYRDMRREQSKNLSKEYEIEI